MKISVIIPSYKSEKFLEKNTGLVAKEIEKITKDYEILLVEGGSPDNSAKVAEAIAKNNGKVRHIHRKERLGKGSALSLGFKNAKGDISAFIDADLDIKPRYLKKVIEKVRQGYDIAIVSQHHPKSRFHSASMRKTLSKSYNLLVRLLLGSKIKGHQGGLKCFKKEAIRAILPLVKDQWWFWDTEVLMIGQRMGFRIIEVPIAGGYNTDGSTVQVVDDSINLFKSILAMKLRLMTELSGLKTKKKKESLEL